LIPLQGRRIALVGGAGFIGHNLALSLKADGADVSIVDGLQVNNFLAFQANSHKQDGSEFYLRILEQRMELLRKARIPTYVQDVRDYHATNKILSEIKPQVIVHLAAVAHANVSNKDPYSTFDHSLRTLENTLDYARNGVEQFIYFSSSMVYGNFKTGTVDEATICEPLGIYGGLKFAGEKMVIGYNQVFKVPFTIIRPSALYGERCVSRRVGQIFIENAAQGRDVAISGDGQDRLDFTYIQDLVDGVKLCLQKKEALGETFNITYGQSRSLNDMVAILRDHFPAAKVEYLPKDKLMPDRGTLSVEKAKRILGYNPQFPLEKGFVQYINWNKQLMNASNDR
jgi:nucleoside-diphosphate-sugar epimerase